MSQHTPAQSPPAESAASVTATGPTGATTAAGVESRALLFAIGGFLAAAVIGLILFGGRDVPLAGANSLGNVTAVVSAVIALVVFIAGYVLSYAEPSRAWLRDVRLGRQFLDIGGLAFAHAVLCFLAFGVLFKLLEGAFIGAVVFPFAAAAMLGAACAASSYFVFLSAVHMTTSRVAATMAIFLVLGLLTSMLTAGDPNWWKMNISALGMSDDLSGYVFNFTLVIAGIVITTMANYMTAELESGPLTRTDETTTDAVSRGRARYVKWSLVLIGVFLACVGIFPVDDFFAIHNTVAIGMAVVFAVLVFRLPWVVPGLPRAFFVVGFLFIAVIAATAVSFATGYYNLTAVEIIAFALIFTWLIVLIRMVSAAATDAAAVVAPSPLVE
ncbi:hypothetical protein ASF62_14085 [Leifsonia sp. Leaf325]|nr:hypothetical protein [Leifsonia sp. Leaf325]KQQ92920.1 hypothetical protein ASF62_14085 [Leifsonia sp. Leaf325]